MHGVKQLSPGLWKDACCGTCGESPHGGHDSEILTSCSQTRTDGMQHDVCPISSIKEVDGGACIGNDDLHIGGKCGLL